MRLMIIAAGAALTLAACSGRSSEQNAAANMANDSNMMMTDSNLLMDQNLGSDAGTMDANGASAAGGADGNAATNAATENAMMQKDLNTHDRDTNLANGM